MIKIENFKLMEEILYKLNFKLKYNDIATKDYYKQFTTDYKLQITIALEDDETIDYFYFFILYKENNIKFISINYDIYLFSENQLKTFLSKIENFAKFFIKNKLI